jgi:hypothetical protein
MSLERKRKDVRGPEDGPGIVQPGNDRKPYDHGCIIAGLSSLAGSCTCSGVALEGRLISNIKEINVSLTGELQRMGEWSTKELTIRQNQTVSRLQLDAIPPVSSVRAHGARRNSLGNNDLQDWAT